MEGEASSVFSCIMCWELILESVLITLVCTCRTVVGIRCKDGVVLVRAYAVSISVKHPRHAIS